MRAIQSSVNSKTMRNLYVNEQAYNPCKLPLSGWVCKVKSKGSLTSLPTVSSYATFKCGFLFKSFFD